jgi:hypothetical protein
MRVTRRSLNDGGWNPFSARLRCFSVWRGQLAVRCRCGKPCGTANRGSARPDPLQKPDRGRVTAGNSTPPFSKASVTVCGLSPVTRLISPEPSMLLACSSAASAARTVLDHRASVCRRAAKALPARRPSAAYWRNYGLVTTPIPAPLIILVTPDPFLRTLGPSTTLSRCCLGAHQGQRRLRRRHVRGI